MKRMMLMLAALTIAQYGSLKINDNNASSVLGSTMNVFGRRLTR